MRNKYEIKEYQKRYRINNVQRLKEYNKQYREENEEEIKIKKKEYREKNKSLIREKKRIYREKNAKRIKEKKRQYHLANAEKIRKKVRDYYKNHKKERLEYWRLYQNHRQNTDIEYKILCQMRTRLNFILKNRGAKKVDHTITILGCSIRDFIRHIESKFLTGMTWDNYGKMGWHIDHIKPCATFDLTRPEDQRICFNYRNLQPLWGIDNLRKNSFYKGKYIRNKEKK
jgi:hypothetical protein